MKERKPLSIEQMYKVLFASIIVVASLFLIAEVVLFVLYLNNKDNTNLLIGMFVTTVLCVVGVLVIGSTIIRNNRKVFFDGIYKTTQENFKKILDQRVGFTYYNDNLSSSFIELNETLKRIDDRSSKSVIFNGYLDYFQMGLEFVDVPTRIVTYKTFKNNYKVLLLRALCFRNAFISYKYETNGKPFTFDEKVNFARSMAKIFNYARVLVVDNSENNELIVFVPKFDSLDRLKEEISLSLASSNIIRYGKDGNTIVLPQAAAVIYPYSEIDTILLDLEYAARSKEQINIYIPKRQKLKNTDLLQTNINLNFTSDIIEKLTSINVEEFELKANKEKFDKTISQYVDYLGFDICSIFVYDEEHEKFFNSFAFEKEGRNDENIKELKNGFLETLEEHLDEDSSYFFSSRDHANADIGRILDIYGIESGYFYAVKSKNKIFSIILFAKYSPLFIDSYLRESLLVVSKTISNILYYYNDRVVIDRLSNKLETVLKITDLICYSVDKDTFEITDFSETMKELNPSIKLGQKCHKVLFDRRSQCAQCPLKTGKKMYEEITGKNYEASLVLSQTKDKNKTLLLSRVEDEDFGVRERYDRDLLINTYYSFVETMRNNFLVSLKGYVVFMSIDNQNKLLQAFNNETYNEYLRGFINEINKNIPEVGDIYYIPNKTLAFILPDGHRKDIFTITEKIYLLSKRKYSAKMEADLKLTYFAHSYPFGYQNSDDYVRYIINLSHTYKQYEEKDMVILPETKYVRSASHKAFVNDILDNSLDTNTFQVRLQPLVRKQDRRIASAEMLLRVSESYLGTEMNTLEIINAAVENNKITTITNILIQKIGSLYKEYEEKLFKKYNLNGISLNTDFSFFQDPEFVSKVKDLETTYNLPPKFLTFEIQESEIANHLTEFSNITKLIIKNDINLVVDNYAGKYLTIDKVEELGFQGIKVDRSVVGRIQENENAFISMKRIVSEAAEHKLKVTLVGVENKEQYTMLKEDSHDFLFQGYYFYKPLNADELINFLIKSND